MSANTARRFAALLVLVLTAVALGLSGGARADLSASLIELDAVSVENGVAVVSGTIDTHGLEVEGVPIVVDASGRFTAVVDLAGDDAAVSVSYVGESGEDILLRIPLALLGNGRSTDGLLDNLFGSGITIEIPPDGFQVVDERMPVVKGRVLERDRLASLTVNGREVLSLLRPGNTFSVLAPSHSSRTVAVTATDTSGVSQTSTFRTISAIGTRTATSVSAASAHGIRIAKLRVDRSELPTKGLVGVVATVEDRRGLVIHDAAVRLTGNPARLVKNGPVRAGFTNRFGKIAFRIALEKAEVAACEREFFVLTVRAKTPRAAATKRALLRLPAELGS
jgi:hypothetical protein